MDRTYEALLEENNELRKALSSTKELVERFRSDNDSLKRIHEDFKLHHERLKKECQEAHARCSEALSSKKETESYYENYIKRMRNSIEQRKKEFDEMQAKMIPPVDSELLRVKLVNEIEGPMRVALENKQDDIMKLHDSLNETNRKFELVSLEYSSFKSEIERETRSVRERHSHQVTQYFKEIEEMQHRLDDPSDKENLRLLKRDREELKLKVEKLSDEVEEVRKGREQLKTQLNHTVLGQNRALDEEKNATRLVRMEKDKLDLQARDLQEQLRRTQTSLDSAMQELHSLKKELEAAQGSLESAEAANSYTRDEIGELQKKLQEQDSLIGFKVRETSKLEREKSSQFKEERDKLQKQVEELELRDRESASAAAANERSLKHDSDSKSQELNSLREDLKLIESRNMAVNKELELLKHTYTSKTTEADRMDSEYKSVRDKLSEMTRREEQLVTAKQRLEDTVKLLQKELGNRPDSQEPQHSGDRLRHLQLQLQFYKDKVRDYKARVRQANEKLHELGLKLAHSEIERQKAGRK